MNATGMETSYKSIGIPSNVRPSLYWAVFFHFYLSGDKRKEKKKGKTRFSSYFIDTPEVKIGNKIVKKTSNHDIVKDYCNVASCLLKFAFKIIFIVFILSKKPGKRFTRGYESKFSGCFLIYFILLFF